MIQNADRNSARTWTIRHFRDHECRVLYPEILRCMWEGILHQIFKLDQLFHVQFDAFINVKITQS